MNNIERIVKESTNKIRPPHPDTILQNVQHGIKNYQHPVLFVAWKLVVAVFIAALFVAAGFIVYFLPRNMNGEFYEAAARPAPLRVNGGGDDMYDVEFRGLAIPIPRSEFMFSAQTHLQEGLFIGTSSTARTQDGIFRDGAMNIHGEIAIPFEFFSFQGDFSNGVIVASKPDGIGQATVLVDIQGNVLFDEIEGRSFHISWGDNFIGDYLGVRFGRIGFVDYRPVVINRAGEIVLQSEDYSFGVVGNGLFRRTDSPAWSALPGNEVVVDINNNVIFDHDLMLRHGPGWTDPYVTGYILDTVDARNFLWGFTSIWDEENFLQGIFCLQTNTFITEPIFYHLTPFSNGRALAQNLDGDVVIIDRTGTEISNVSQTVAPLEILLPAILPFGSGVAPIHFMGGDGDPIIINDNGDIITDTNFGVIRQFSDCGIAVFRQNARFGFINTAGEVLHAPTLSFATNVYQGVAFVRDGLNQYRLLF